WDELKARIEPEDRCIYGFFHPSLADEPLVFIEVALMDEMPDSIDMILLENRKIMTSKASRTAVFYSISNCQDGLRGIPLGSFLIKQVVEDLKTRFPSLKEFVTLSPVPGFASWMRENASAEFDTDTIGEARPDEALKPQIMAAAAHYLCAEKSGAGMPRDPVARFHLGNGARLERLNWNANLSKAGQLQSFGVMANYHYKLDDIELNHERFFELGTIAATATVTKLAKAHRDRPQAAQIAEAEIAPAPATAN
ncbi:MAG: malonyl-CoA decarboxylase family protein, partial [Pseudomonadota bacterium]